MTMTVTCNDCGYSGTVEKVALHSCDVQNNGGRCEDYPCCGHTDGDGCQTLPEHTSAYWMRPENAVHINCNHEEGECNAEYDDVDMDDDEPEQDYSGAFDGFSVTSDADPGL